MSDGADFKPLPRGKGKGARKDGRRVVGATTPSRRTGSSRSPSRPRETTGTPRATPRAPRRSTRPNPFRWIKYLSFLMMVGVGVYLLANLQPPPPPLPADYTPDPNATLVPTSLPIFPIVNLPSLPTARPTASPTPTVPAVAIVAGHWAREPNDGVPAVLDSGAVCPDGLREVDITKSVADKTVSLLKRQGYPVVLLEEFDPVYKTVNPDFAPKSFLSIHADSCLTGPDYAYATGYKIAHAEPSDNEPEDARLVTCLTRSYDLAVAKYNLPFNANTITRNMTEYHAFRKIDPHTPAAIIELGFLGQDREILVNHQDELARGLAAGLQDFLNGQPCQPPTITPAPTETTLP